jgi:hypothetical protein
MHDADSSSILGNNVSDYLLSSYLASEIFEGADIDVLSWICSGLPSEETSPPCQSRIGEISKSPETWVIDGYNSTLWPVNYCLSESSTVGCRLYFNSVIATIVTALNFCKYQF